MHKLRKLWLLPVNTQDDPTSLHLTLSVSQLSRDVALLTSSFQSFTLTSSTSSLVMIVVTPTDADIRHLTAELHREAAARHLTLGHLQP